MVVSVVKRPTGNATGNIATTFAFKKTAAGHDEAEPESVDPNNSNRKKHTHTHTHSVAICSVHLWETN